jgi:hypothetical protein
MPDDVKNAIEQNALGPSSARGDSGEVRQHPLPDQIAADKYLAANQASKRNHGGIRMVKLQAPGSVL